MEKWDLLDENRLPLGMTINRGEPLPKNSYHVIIGVWTIHITLKKLLLTRRSFDKAICPGQWENTGGSILSGETSRVGAAREVCEETGMPCLPTDLIHIAQLKDHNLFVDCYLYYTDIDPNCLIMQVGETIDYQWVNLDELEDLIKQGVFALPEIKQYQACKEHLENALIDL